MANHYTAYILIDFPELACSILDYKSIGNIIFSKEANLKLPFFHNDLNLGAFEIELAQVVPPSVKESFQRHPRIDNLDFLKVTLDFDLDRLSALYEKDNRESPDFLILKRIEHILIVCNIAVPGIFDWHGGSLSLNGKEIWRISTRYNEFDFALEKSKDLSWPLLDTLDIEQVWRWYFKHEKGLEKVSSSPTERALNALSHLFTSSGDWEFGSIFWALLGLEALYCKGNNNLQSQLVEKTELFLGKRTAFKKEVGRMYDFRSRFIHGNINFPNKFSYDDISDEWNKYLESYQSSFHLATAILLATIQKLIKTNKDSIDFELVLID